MKKLIYCLLYMFALQVFLISCNEDDVHLGTPPETGDAAFTYTPTANKNILKFTSPHSVFLKRWDFGNGSKTDGDTATIKFPLKGTYVVTLTAYTAGGSITSTQTIEIAQTDPTLLNIPFYNFLTGGVDASSGKTWIVDKDSKGHLGVGPSSEDWPEWYAASSDEKEGKNLYDDEMTFKLANFAFDYNANGTIYVNGAFSNVFPNSVSEGGGGGDFFAPYPEKITTWSAVETSKDKWEITINDGGHLGYYSGASTYQVISISADEMYVRSIQGGAPANAWYQKFIRKGFVRTPPPPPPAPEYKIADIYENFDGNSNVTFIANSNGTMATYDNPATVPINTSLKVGKYIKADGAGGEYANVQIKPGYKMDLHNRNVFKMKVFIPGFNDYTTDNGSESWQSYHTLQKQLSVKLQNGDLGGNAYTTQYEVIQKNLDTDKWIELTFDFSAVVDREDFDTIVIQFGGEAIFTGGIFYLDDFELLP